MEDYFDLDTLYPEKDFNTKRIVSTLRGTDTSIKVIVLP